MKLKSILWRGTTGILLYCLASGSVSFAQGSLPRGTIVTVAGSTKTYGFGGDQGPAVQAMLSLPWGIAVDGRGAFYIADTSNQRIRKVDPNGVITTIAGIGPDGFLNDNGVIGGEGSFSGDGGPATAAAFNLPQDVALDNKGNLWISDINNARVRQIDAQGIITTRAGDGKGGSSQGSIEGKATSTGIGAVIGLAFDAAGNLYIASLNNRVYQVNPTGQLRAFAGTGQETDKDPTHGDNGPATLATVSRPTGVTTDRAGNVYIVEQARGTVRKVGLDGTIQTVAQGLKSPQSVAVDAAGNLFISNTFANTVLEVRPDETMLTVAGTGEAGFAGDGGLANEAKLNTTGDIAIDADGNLFIADTENNRIRKVIGVAAPGLLAGVPFPGSGDVVRDGQVNIGDALRALRAAISVLTLSLEEQAFADVNGDQQIDLKDVILILHKALQ
jgi:sugar lactone lactonase YvrE